VVKKSPSLYDIDNDGFEDREQCVGIHQKIKGTHFSIIHTSMLTTNHCPVHYPLSANPLPPSNHILITAKCKPHTSNHLLLTANH
jgi:hypothetical protein